MVAQTQRAFLLTQKVFLWLLLLLLSQTIFASADSTATKSNIKKQLFRILSLNRPFHITRVNNINDPLCPRVIMSPIRTERVLSTNIPNL